MFNSELKTGIYLFRNRDNKYTQINNLFIDDFIVNADGEFVKIYLLLVRLNNGNGQKISIDEIANKLEISPKKVIRAFDYWNNKGLLKVDYTVDGEPVKLEVVDDISEISIKEKQRKQERYNIVKVDEDYNIDYEEEIFIKSEENIGDRYSPIKYPNMEDVSFSTDDIKELSENKEIKELVSLYQYFGKRVLSFREQQFLLYMYKTLGFKLDICEYIIEYCLSNNHYSVDYLKRVALDWANKGIKTVDQAKEYVSSSKKEYKTIMKELGFNGEVTPTHKIQFDKWLNEHSYEIIIEACKQTVSSIGKGNLNYVSKILTEWKKNGISNLKELEIYNKNLNKNRFSVGNESNYKNSFTDFRQRDINGKIELENWIARNWNEA